MEEAAAVPPEPLEDDEHDAKEAVLHRYFLQEWQIVKSILDKIVSDGRASDLSDVQKIRSILGKYQEQGQLVEPYLESIASPLMLIVRSRATELSVAVNEDEALQSIKPLCIIIYTLVTVCGYKSVIRFFPHQVSDLELAVGLLEKCHNEVSSGAENSGDMETKCVLLLWLYILVLIPFDISSVDTSMASCDHPSCEGSPSLVARILEISKFYLSNAGPMRSMSGLLLSRLLTRPDMTDAFRSFIEWAHEVLLSVTDDLVDHFRLLGVVDALASIFKVGNRKLLIDSASIIWDDVSLLRKSATVARSPLLRKLLVKLSQRIGLIYLPHRSMSWHYLLRTRILDKSISPSSSNASMHDQLDDHSSALQISSSAEEEDMDVPEIIEDIIELLRSGLRDTDTVVRWSAAKGIGRITARLTVTLSDEVLISILELFATGEGDGSWHGGCLALAELGRRGLLLPVSIAKVIPFLVKALHYDVRRGPHSVGSHVRDAAAYVCWAFGRSYSNSDMKTILEQLAPHLLTVACYDREVNCRRAASAAFQENVGRQGSFPHGIDIVNAADYFSLASRANSYLNVAVYIAQYKDYLYSFVEELICFKISHWDKSVREIAAKALSALTKYDKEYFATFVLDKLIPCTLSSDLFMRHGATLAAGELVLALHQLGYDFSVEKQRTLAGVVPGIEKSRLYRGKGGEIMRSSVSRYIECTSIYGISLNEKLKQSLLETLDENLKHPNAQIQIAAVDALKHFVVAYLDSKIGTEIISRYLKLLDDPNAAARRGSALAFGVLPYEFLVTQWRVILGKLCKCCTIQHLPEDPDAESRLNAVKGLVCVCEAFADACKVKQVEEAVSIFLFLKNEVMHTLFNALDDYSVDNRGDVGSWVREASINGLERLTHILCERDSFVSKECGENHLTGLSKTEFAVDRKPCPLFDASIAANLIGGIAKQAVEKLDKLREAACKALQRLLYCQKYFIPFIPYRHVLEDIIPQDTNMEWGVPSISYPHLVQMLQLSCYSKHIVSGLVISVGGLQESLRKTSLTALLEFLKNSELDTNKNGFCMEYSLSDDLLWTLKQYEKCDRIISPTLKICWMVLLANL